MAAAPSAVRSVTSPLGPTGRKRCACGRHASSTQGGGANHDVSGMLNLPLIEDKFALRANLGYFDNDGYIDNVRLGVNRTSIGTALYPAGSHLLARPIDPLQDRAHALLSARQVRRGSLSLRNARRTSAWTLTRPKAKVRRAGLTNLSVTATISAGAS